MARGLTSFQMFQARSVAVPGAMPGLDLLMQSVVMTLVILGILTGANWLENSFKALQRGVHRHTAMVRRKQNRNTTTSGTIFPLRMLTPLKTTDTSAGCR